MLTDIVASIGFIGAAELLHVTRERVHHLIAGRERTAATFKMAVWMAWLWLCRPGAVNTVQEAILWGRFTKHGSPAHAGKHRKPGAKRRGKPPEQDKPKF